MYRWSEDMGLPFFSSKCRSLAFSRCLIPPVLIIRLSAPSPFVPNWKLPISASPSLLTTVAVAAGGNELTIAGATSSRVYYIDCDAQIIWHIESNEIVVDTQLSSGKFPVLIPGSNSVTGSMSCAAMAKGSTGNSRILARKA